MPTTKININKINDFEQEIEKQVNKILEERFEDMMKDYLSKYNLTIEDLARNKETKDESSELRTYEK